MHTYEIAVSPPETTGLLEGFVPELVPKDRHANQLIAEQLCFRHEVLVLRLTANVLQYSFRLLLARLLSVDRFNSHSGRNQSRFSRCHSQWIYQSLWMLLA